MQIIIGRKRILNNVLLGKTPDLAQACDARRHLKLHFFSCRPAASCRCFTEVSRSRAAAFRCSTESCRSSATGFRCSTEVCRSCAADRRWFTEVSRNPATDFRWFTPVRRRHAADFQFLTEGCRSNAGDRRCVTEDRHRAATDKRNRQPYLFIKRRQKNKACAERGSYSIFPRTNKTCFGFSGSLVITLTVFVCTPSLPVESNVTCSKVDSPGFKTGDSGLTTVQPQLEDTL